MIFTDKAAKEKIASLESRITDLEADLATKDSAIETLQADVASRDQTIAEHAATIGTQAEKINTADKLAKENAQTITDLQSAVEAAKNSAAQTAVEIAAAAGIEKPLAIEGEGNSGSSKTMTRAEFANMKPSAAMKLIKEGVKITD